MNSGTLSDINSIKLRSHRIFGGIKPRSYKSSSLRSRIMPSPIPKRLILSLKQNDGTAARPIVKTGDFVLKYQLIALAEKDDALNLHAPTSGRIVAIKPHSTPDLGQHPSSCIYLETDNKDRSIWLSRPPDYQVIEHRKLLKLFSQAGICSLNDLGFSHTQKNGQNNENNIGLLIINAAESDPYTTANEALLREFAEEVVSGARILQKVSMATRCVIVIEKHKHDSIAATKTALKNSAISLIELPDKYPISGDKQIVQGVTGLEVPSGGTPKDIGILVKNVGTAFATHKAIINGEPHINRITTLTGQPMRTPKNFEALIGTPVSYLFKICGVDNSRATGAIVDGSIMGVELSELNVPLLKKTSCVIVKSKKEFPLQGAEQACIRCGFCADACPIRLLPQQLYAYARSRNNQELKSHGLTDCIECGACSYVCPANIPLVQYYRASKASLREISKSEEQTPHWKSHFQNDQNGIERNQESILPIEETKKIADKSKFHKLFSKGKTKTAAALAWLKTRRKNISAIKKQK